MANDATRIGIREARAVLPSLVQQAADGAVFVLTVRGADRCAVVPLELLQKLTEQKQQRATKRRPK
ncbi:MAG: type II toxin-antitoxin system Phd/YefM family antitoxin [Planctomycetes bacterium]|nr:type II toxin-antitoxin system Phd/YefM family antitoxin [Planctomycetota bacterium]